MFRNDCVHADWRSLQFHTPLTHAQDAGRARSHPMRSKCTVGCKILSRLDIYVSTTSQQDLPPTQSNCHGSSLVPGTNTTPAGLPINPIATRTAAASHRTSRKPRPAQIVCGHEGLLLASSFSSGAVPGNFSGQAECPVDIHTSRKRFVVRARSSQWQ